MQTRDDSEMKKAQRVRYASRELVQKIHTMIDLPYLTPKEMKKLCVIIVDEDSRQRVLDEINESMWNDGGKKVWMDKVYTTQFKDIVLNNLAKRAETEMGLSQIMLLIPYQTMEGGHRDHYAPDIFTMFMVGGEVGLIFGDLGSGKTDLAVEEIIRPSLEKGLPVVSNIYIEEFYPDELKKNYKYTTSLSETLLFICENAIDSLKKYNYVKPIVRVTDDSGLSRLRQRASEPKNIAQRQLTIVNRKLGVFDWFLYQLDWDVPKELLYFKTHDILKRSRKDLDKATLKVDGKRSKCFYQFKGIKGMNDRKNVGLNYLGFDTYHWEILDVDVNVSDLFEYICKLGKKNPLKTIEQYEAITGWIRRHRGEYHIDKESITNMLKLIKEIHPDMSYRALGELVGWSETTVWRLFKKDK